MTDHFWPENSVLRDILVDTKPDIMLIHSSTKEVIRIDPEGRIFWHGREVESDADFRAAMLEMVAHLFPRNKP